jgi:hypothetical protein
MTIYAIPRPTLRLPDLLALEAAQAGGELTHPINLTIEGVPAQIRPVLGDVSVCSRPLLAWTIGSAVGQARRPDLALQSILVQAIRSRMPAPLELCEFDRHRLPTLTVDVDQAVLVYRDLLLRRTGFAWSVRVGNGKHRQRITISTMPKDRIGGRMTARHAALLAAMLDRDTINPSGLSIPNSARDRVQLAGDLAGVELAGERLAAR